MPGKPLDALEARLRRELTGEVLFDAWNRGRYSTDASIYQIEPLGVVVPRTADEAVCAAEAAVAAGVPILPRGAGTSQCGQTVGAALVIDTSKHLNRLLEVDTDEPHRLGRARHRPRRAERPLEAVRPLVPRRRFDVGASHDRRHDGEQQLRRSLAALRQHGPQRPRDRDVAHERRNADVRRRPRRPAGWLGSPSRARGQGARVVRARAGRDRSARAEAAAARGRLQPRPGVGGRVQPRAAARRLRRNARAIPQDQAQACAAADAQGARRGALPYFLSSDGPHSAHRRARTHGRRARRPHDDRAVARHRGLPRDHGQDDPRRAGRDPARRVRGRRARSGAHEVAPPERAHGRISVCPAASSRSSTQPGSATCGRSARPASTS